MPVLLSIHKLSSVRVEMAQTMGAFEPVRDHERLVVQHINRRPFGHDPASIHHEHAGTDLNDQFQIVRGDDAGVREAPKPSDQPPSATWIEVG